MYFKDKAYYVNKVKNFLGMALTVLIFDAFIVLLFALNYGPTFG